MANTTEQTQELRFRGKGEENAYTVLLNGEQIGKVVRVEGSRWTPEKAPKGFEPGSRKSAAIALSGLKPEQVSVIG